MESQQIEKHALSSGFILKNCYKIQQVIGEGGFCITYEGIRVSDNKRVAIKEYSSKGMKGFLHEADSLRRFGYLDSIVSILDTYMENDAAYIIMEYIEGITLRQYVQENGVFAYSELIELMTPLMKSLSQIHRQGLIHRDISPENILIGLDNKFYLIDFNAANVLEEGRQRHTVVLKTGYAPPEQYVQNGKQGAWTDVYGLVATIVYALTGEAPADSVQRLQEDILWQKLEVMQGLSEWQRDALSTGMSLQIARRYKDMESLLLALTIPPSVEERKTRVVSLKEMKAFPKRQGIGFKIGLMLGVTAVLLCSVYAVTKLFIHPAIGEQSMEEKSTEETTGSAEQLFIMPNVVGLNRAIAIERLKQADSQLQVLISLEYSMEQSEGVVISQSVKEGTRYNAGAIEEITLIISQGAEPTTEETITEESKTEKEEKTTKQEQKSTKKEVSEKKDYDVIEESEFDEIDLGD